MFRKAPAAAIAWCCLTLVSGAYAQTAFEVDFDSTFPAFGYAYGYSGYGDATCAINTDSSDQVVATYDVSTPPAAIGEFDTSGWNVPSDACYDYAGWGLGIGISLPEGMRPTSADLSQYSVTLDASVNGYDPVELGLTTEVTVIFQIPDENGDDRSEEYRIGVNGNNLGNLSEVPMLNDTPQNLSFNLADLAVLSTEYDFPTRFAETFYALLQVQPASNGAVLGTDSDNVLTVDNVRLEGPFAQPILGDFDGDQIVDGADFLIWQRNESPGGIFSTDLQDWKANFGYGGASAAVLAVPEPGSLTLIAAAILPLLATVGIRRRR